MDIWTRSRGSAVVLAAVVAVLGLLMVAPAGAQAENGVLAIEMRGPITQVSDDHLADAIDQAEQMGATALLVELDTPGGGLETTRAIVRRILASDVPVVVYVAPSGSRAGSAGVFITYAAHVAAMAPGTNIGAATPVDAEGDASVEKILEDTASFAQSLAEERGRNIEFAVEAVREARAVTADTALEIGAVDLLASSREELLTAIDGQEVPLGSGGTTVLRTADAAVTDFAMGWARSVLQWLANPQLAFLFISIGTLAVIYELANPGAGLGGAVGAVMLVLAFYSLSVLPTNAAGVILLVVALGFFVAELFAPGVGVLAGSGTLALLFAGLLLFDRSTGITLSWTVLLPTVLLAGAGTVALGVMAARDRHRPATVGYGTLVGRPAEVRTATRGYAQVFVDGALWEAAADGGELEPGQRVRVVGQDGLRLIVEVEEE
jgi:membrane-bound serine protease (ClpP class)